MIDRPYKTSAAHLAWAKSRRVRNDLTGVCINDNLRNTHGPATHGVRCEACHVVHKRTR